MRLLRLFYLLILLQLIAGCNQVRVESLWKDRDIIIDGNDMEWINTKIILEKEHVAFGVFNDDNNLYIDLTTSDKQLQKQILGKGLTLFFGTEETGFGIKYPVASPGGVTELLQMSRESTKQIDTVFQKRFLNELEIIKNGSGQSQRLSREAARGRGIEVMLGRKAGVLMYEMKIPLSDKDKADMAVSIRFETSEIDQEDSRDMKRNPQQRRARRASGGSGMKGDLRGSGPVGGYGGYTSHTQGHFELEVQVDLAIKK